MADDNDVVMEEEPQTLSQTSLAAKERQRRALEEFELRRKMQSLAVPTNLQEVKKALRSIDEPVTLFGEGEMERRERLKRIIAERGISLPAWLIESGQEMHMYLSQKQKELFFTEGTQELVLARYTIADFSLQRAKERIAAAKRRRESGEKADFREVLEHLKNLTSECSEIADARPVAGCQFSPDSKCILTGSWTGCAKIWSVPDCKLLLEQKAHNDRITGVAWYPELDNTMFEENLAFATASADRTAKLWSTAGKMLHELKGHTDRLGRIAFHPMGLHLATASFDTTWRFWDVETGTCLLEQEGHSRAVYTIAFQCDGSLAASGGLDAIGRIWDCRSGRSILTLQGHVKSILGIDFSPNGYCLVTGSEDHTCRIWDLRRKDCVYSIPAHTSLVSQVCYEHTQGAFIFTTGYDNQAKIWSNRDYSLVKVLTGHEGKIMCGDNSANPVWRLATVGFDRTLKFWRVS